VAVPFGRIGQTRAQPTSPPRNLLRVVSCSQMSSVVTNLLPYLFVKNTDAWQAGPPSAGSGAEVLSYLLRTPELCQGFFVLVRGF
jgi:hypothetical protein